MSNFWFLKRCSICGKRIWGRYIRNGIFTKPTKFWHFSCYEERYERRETQLSRTTEGKA